MSFLKKPVSTAAAPTTPIWDTVYDAGSKVVDADAGPFVLQNYGMQAPWQVEPKASAPSLSLAYGQEYTAILTGGFPCKAVYDNTRSKWLSTQLKTSFFGKKGPLDSGYLRVADSLHSQSGFAFPYDGTIVAVTIRISSGDNTKKFFLRKNGTTANVDTYTLPGSNLLIENTTNVNFSSGEYFNIFVDSFGGVVKNPIVTLWYAWRF